MDFPSIRFQNSDFSDSLPEEGFHEAAVCSVRCRTSESGNPIVQVVYDLPTAPVGQDRMVDHFVIAGRNERAIAVGRRRLLSLFRACGREPEKGQDVSLQDLIGSRLVIRIGHDSYEGAPRARVVSYRQLG